jgi:predicted transcriptional regulator
MSSTLGLLGKNWSHKLEYCSNDSWTEPIPAVVFELPYEEWLINWLLPEASEDKDTIQKNDDNPERKDLTSWKELVKARDKVCIVCGDEKHLECHHVYPFGLYPELRDDVNNGVVLCRWCHRRYHSHYGKEERVNPSTLMQFVQRFGTGATQSHVTTVEHVQQVLKGDAHMSKKGKLEQIIEIIKGYNQDDQPCTMVELFKDSNLTMLKLEELLDALAVKGVVYQFPEGQYHVA